MTSRTVRALPMVAAVVGMSYSPAGAPPTDLSRYGVTEREQLQSKGIAAQGVRHVGANAANGSWPSFAPPFASDAEPGTACRFPNPLPTRGGEAITVERGRTRVTPGSYGTRGSVSCAAATTPRRCGRAGAATARRTTPFGGTRLAT